MTNEEKQVVNNLLNKIDSLLTNMADCGDYEDAESGNIRPDVDAVERAIANVNKLVDRV